VALAAAVLAAVAAAQDKLLRENYGNNATINDNKKAKSFD
jgi:hypothetical protein